MSSDEKSPSLTDVVSASTFVITLITAWLYAAGWNYAYTYLDHFRIPLLMVDLPFQHYLIYGSLVVWGNLMSAALIAAVVVALSWAGWRWRNTLGRFWLSVLLILAIAGLFELARSGGVATARADFLEERDSDYAAYPRVALSLKKEAAANAGTRLADIAGTDCGRLVLFSGGRFFLIRPIHGAAGADLDSFVVPADQVEAVRITHQYGSCP